MMIANFLKILILMCCLSWLFISMSEKFFYSMKPNETIHPRPTVSSKIIDLIKHDSHIITFWTKYFGASLKESAVEENYSLNHLNCSYKNCWVTSNRALASVSEAFIFHWRDFDPDDLPPIRRRDQYWVLHNLEAPTHSKYLFGDDIYFNLTSSYRFDSDLHNPYGQIIKRPKPLPENFLSLNHKDKIIGNKTKQAVWFVSNCKTPGSREAFVKELKKYMQVDVYGACGPHKCGPSRSSKCDRLAERHYKFYLSFENSICRDYVTEKLYKILDYDIIPVVFGGADYKSILPSHSYIDASKFKPKELAKFLYYLSNNDKEYQSYFNWKRFYYVKQGLEFSFLCDLCKMINQKPQPKLGHSISDIMNWWFKQGKCKSWKL